MRRAAIEALGVRQCYGEAAIYGSEDADGVVRVSLEDVPVAPAGHHYEVWLLRRQETAMQSIGAFTPTSSAVDLELALPGAGDYAAVDISVEEDGGPPRAQWHEPCRGHVRLACLVDGKQAVRDVVAPAPCAVSQWRPTLELRRAGRDRDAHERPPQRVPGQGNRRADA